MPKATAITESKPKLSTVLRTAIDTYLWDGVGLREHEMECPSFICIALNNVPRADADTVQTLTAHIMHDIVNYTGRSGTPATTFSVALANSGCTLEERVAAYNNKAELQQLRYMYADFIAYWLEDQGL